MFRVVIQRRAELDVRRTLNWIERRSPQGAVAWLDEYDEAVERMRCNPFACPVLPQSDRLRMRVRFLMFQTRHGLKYSVLFLVDEGGVGDPNLARSRTRPTAGLSARFERSVNSRLSVETYGNVRYSGMCR